MATQMPVVPPSNVTPGSTPPKKTNWFLWGLLGCGGLIVLVILIITLGVTYIWHKVPKTPAQLAASLITANNPDAEVVGIDEGKGLVKIRDKKTGKVITINLEDAKKGKITFSGEGNEKVTFDAAEAGKEGLLRVQTKEGTATIGAGVPKNLPVWVPLYPGAKAAGGASSQMAGAEGGELSFNTNDSSDKVLQFYHDALAKAGFQVSSMNEEKEGMGLIKVVSGTDPVNKRNVNVSVRGQNDGTLIMVFYQAEK